MIVHVIESGGLYGIEHVLLGLLPACRRMGREVALACVGRSDGPNSALGKALAARGVRVEYAGYRGRLSPRGVWALDRLLARLKPRLVHLHGYKATILGGALSLLRRVPAVATYHAEARRAMDIAHIGLYVALETPVLRRISSTIAVSQPIAAELAERGVPIQRIRVIPNGIDDHDGQPGSESAADPPRSAVLLIVGRLIPEKGMDFAIRAVAELRRWVPEVQLLVAGAGPLREELGRLAVESGVADAVRFLGFVEDIRGLIARCDCVLMPSRTEGSPVSLLEAMAASRAIVASAVGGIPGTIEDGVEGIVVAPGDVPALVAALRSLLEDPGRRAALGAAARRRDLRDYSSDRMAERYIELYDEVLSAPAPHAARERR